MKLPRHQLEWVLRLVRVPGGWSANLTLPDCVRVARFYRELGFAPNQGLGE